MIQAAKDVRYITSRMSANNEDAAATNEWVYVGLVMDTVVFRVVGVVLFIGVAYFLTSAPNCYEPAVNQADLKVCDYYVKSMRDAYITRSPGQRM